MAGRPSARLVEAMKLLLASNGHMTPYACAKRAQIALNTMYRASLYKQWKAAQEELDQGKRRAMLAALKLELDVTRPLPRVAKKPQRFAATATNKQH